MRTQFKTKVAEKGYQIYMTKLRTILEPEKNGWFVAIEPDSGDYFLGRTPIEAVEKGKKKHPEKDFFLAKVGPVAMASFKNVSILWQQSKEE